MSAVIIQTTKDGRPWRFRYACPLCRFRAHINEPFDPGVSIPTMTEQEAEAAGWRSMDGRMVCPECSRRYDTFQVSRILLHLGADKSNIPN